MTARDLLSEVQNDGPMAPCAACGLSFIGTVGAPPGRTRQTVEGKLIMLCTNAAACCLRYRRGLTPAVFAARLRTKNGV